jgi:hypothetical protein
METLATERTHEENQERFVYLRLCTSTSRANTLPEHTLLHRDEAIVPMKDVSSLRDVHLRFTSAELAARFVLPRPMS